MMEKRIRLGLHPGNTLESVAKYLNTIMRERLQISRSYSFKGNNVPLVNLYTGPIHADESYDWGLLKPGLGDVVLQPGLFKVTGSGDIVIPMVPTPGLEELRTGIGLLFYPFQDGQTDLGNYIKIGALEDMKRLDEIDRNSILLGETQAHLGKKYKPTGFCVEFFGSDRYEVKRANAIFEALEEYTTIP